MPKVSRPPLSELEIVEIAIRYVFREEGLKQVADGCRFSAQTIRHRLAEFGVRIRDTHEQRHCDRRCGRFSQAEAVREARRRGAYDTERYRETRRNWYGYERHGERNSFFGKHHSESARQKLAEQARKRTIAGCGEYGVDWTEQLRQQIVERDGRQCLVCGSAKMLQVHHVDHDRTNNAASNLLTLCAGCHLGYHGRGEHKVEIEALHTMLLGQLVTCPEAAPC